MKKIFKSVMVLLMSLMTSWTVVLNAQQVPDPGFEDWSGAAFDGNAQLKYWHASNVTQVGFKFNFAHKEAGRNGGSCMMVQQQDVGAMGITETTPGYFTLGNPWVYLASVAKINEATAGTDDGIAFSYRPDSMSVWIKRTGANGDKEDFVMLYYAWSGSSTGNTYKGKNGNCSSVDTHTNEESDIRQAVNANDCGTIKKANQIAEGIWREKKSYGNWTNIRVPIYYLNNTTPEKMNIIFSASQYPNFRISTGMYAGNSLYVDDVELIYSANIQKLLINGVEWKGFDPNSTEVQNYALGETATAIPSIEAKRGAGTITNIKGNINFPGRTLSGKEIVITPGDLDKKPTTIKVTSDDGKKTMTYKIQFQKAASSNAKLAGISYTIGNKTTPLPDFSPSKYNYTVDLPYGTTTAPTLSVEGQEDGQTFAITQPTSVTGTAKIVVTAPNKQATATYNLTFRVAPLADNTLKDIKVNGNSVTGFNPSQAVYKVSLPTSTKTLTVEPVSAYPAGMQKIVITPSPLPSGDDINGSTVQISVTTEGNAVAKVYKLNIKLEASSYSYLKDLSVEGQTMEFVPDQFTYYFNLPLGTTALPKINYTAGDEYQKIEVASLDPGVVDGTVRITVTAGNGDQSVYKLVFSTMKSSNSVLQGITIGGVALEDFAADVTNYSYTLPEGTTELPEIEAVPGDEYQTITVTTAGVNGKTRITVTAGNGSTTIYQISFSVKTFNDNTLKSLSVAGFDIEFDPETNDYYINLPKGTTTLPEVTYELQSTEFQTVRETKPAGLNGEYKITVRPQSGASRTYIIHFSLNKSNNTALKAIYIDNTPLAAFHADTLHYVDSLPEGVSLIPSVTFEKAEASQRVLSVLDGTTQIITVTAETGDTREYRIDFIVRISANAFLEMIYLEGDSLKGFEPEELKYEVELTGDRCPAITVDKAAGQQVTITAPYAAGVAQIKVQPGVGAANIYLINFKKQETNVTVQLSDITFNGKSIEGFTPSKTSYELTYQGARPTIIGIAGEEGQTVSEALWQGAVAWIFVTDKEGNQASYSVACTRLPMTENKLQAIYADGTILPDFEENKTDYAYELEPGSVFPQVTYAAKENAQVAFFGQTAEGEWTIRVAAENGTTTTYTVRYTIKKRSDATLADLKVTGHEIGFLPEKTDYALDLDEGAMLPSITVTAREGQRILSFTDDANHQRVLVTAENGTQNTYTITYSRKQSSNALLANILIDGKKLPGFEPDSFNYAITLPKSTKVMPNIFPVAQLSNQTVTTFYSAPDGTTKIHVVAQDGTTEANYTIDFNVALSTNTKLGSLTINGEEKDVDETDYNFVLPYGASKPYSVAFTKAEPEQLVDFVEAPVNSVTKITVKAQNGDTRTYSIRYTIAQPEGENKVAKIKYTYIDGDSKTQNGELVPVKGDNTIDLPYGSKNFTITDVEKSYPEQSIVFYNGGIRRGAKVIASPNREGELDVTYNVIPNILPDTLNKLKALYYIKAGETIPVPHFSPDVYSYIIPVKEQPTQNTLVAVTYGGKVPSYSDPTKPANVKNKKMTVTVGSGTKMREYSVFWYYEDDDKIVDFSGNWVSVDKGVGYKPSAEWKVPGDCDDAYEWNIPGILSLTYTTGKEVMPGGEKGVLLSTLRGSSINGSVPGMMTLGSMSLELKSAGNSTSSVAKSATEGVTFRNTPQGFAFKVKPLSTNNITNWNIWMTLSDGSKYTEGKYSGNFNQVNIWQTVTIPFSYTNLGTIAKFNVMLSSCDQENAETFGGTTVYESSVMYDHVRFVYNSELTKATIDGIEVTPSGRNFVKNVDANYVGVPALTFTGKVNDQTRTVEWLNGGEWKEGKLTAKVINYGENLVDSTHYYVILQRTGVTSLDYTVDFGAYATKEKNADTTIITLPYGMKATPDVNITPFSIHQRFDVQKNGKALTITVQAEDDASSTHTYLFVENLPSDASVEMIEALDDKNDDIKTFVSEDENRSVYTATSSVVPTLVYTKKDGVVGQTFATIYTADSVVLTVTAADGKTTHKHVVNRLDPAVTSDAQLTDFRIGSTDISLGGTNTSLVMERPDDVVYFNRKHEADSVVFLQDETKMQWTAFATDDISKTKTYTLTYPTEVSTKANLAALKVNGEDYPEFDENMTEYTIKADSAIWLATLLAESEQTQAMTTEIQGDSTIYTTVVTAADGTHKQTYKVIVHRTKSEVSTLAGIYYDGKLIENFRPDSLDYTYIIPAGAYKEKVPQIAAVTYEAGQVGQTVELNSASVLGEPTEFIVTSETGAQTTYTLTVNAEPSHCTELTGITVNGKAIDQFESGRHFYSVSLQSVEANIELLSNDNFQTIVRDTLVIKDSLQYRYGFEVTAEDHIAREKYEVEVYVENKSNDAQLANILIDGKSFVNYERAINPDLVFDPGNNLYTINLPAGTTTLPEVSAQLKMEGQTVDIDQDENNVLLKVTAVDEKTVNTYTLRFVIPQSKNTNLSMIYLNGDSLAGFEPDLYFYQVELPVGTHELPEVVAQKAEAVQTILPYTTDPEKMQTVITVQAEDPATRVSTYTVVFRYTRSDADTLKMIYADGDSLFGFEPTRFYYTYSLPVGTPAFPVLDQDLADEWQTVTMDTVELTQSTLIRQLNVTSESGKKNTYTVTYTILKSDVDTLQMLLVDQKPMPNFKADVAEYYYTLTAAQAAELDGALPAVEAIAGDEYQTVLIAQDRDSLSGKSLGYKSLVTVTAATGTSRTYIIHYPVELSQEATLNMIMLAGQPVANFDAERFNYKMEINVDASVPVVSVVKKEEAQTYEIRVIGDTVLVEVMAEDLMTSQTYTLVFERLLSANTLLRNIVLRDAEGVVLPASQFAFRPEEFAYPEIPLAYVADSLPETLLPSIEVVFSDSMQTADTTRHLLPNGDMQVDVVVTAPNGEDQAIYTLIFHFVKPSDAKLSAITVKEELIADFKPELTEYTFTHPYGTPDSLFFTLDDITYELSDERATDTAYIDADHTIFITVLAQDGTTEMTYTIRQIVGKDSNNKLAWITLNGDSLAGFDPDMDFYTYYLFEGTPVPEVKAQTASENAELDIKEVSAGDTCVITCIAEDQSMRRYYIHFAISAINDGLEPSANDVLLKRIPGTNKIMVGTLRKGVSFALYDQAGRMVNFQGVPVVDPNDAEVYIDADNKDVLNNFNNPDAALVIDVNPGQPYFYTFFDVKSQKLRTGKIILLQ